MCLSWCKLCRGPSVCHQQAKEKPEASEPLIARRSLSGKKKNHGNQRRLSHFAKQSVCMSARGGEQEEKRTTERTETGNCNYLFLLYNTVTAAIVESRGKPFVWRRSNDDAPSCLTSSVLRNIQTLTGIGIRLIRGAPDYITQVQDRGFHVYFGDDPLFTKGSFFLSLLSPRNEENIFSSRNFPMALQEWRSESITRHERRVVATWRRVTAVRRSEQTANQQCKHALMKKRNTQNGEVTATKQQHPHTPTREIHFLLLLFFFFFL